MNNLVIIDYGVSNLRSVQRGFEKVGAKVSLSSNYSKIIKADHLVLPGVGAFEAGMKGLMNAELEQAIYDFVKTGNHLLGICLGMQMFLDYSEENGNHKGLGLIPGKVVKIPSEIQGIGVRKIPHIGWAEIVKPKNTEWEKTCLRKIKNRSFFYFVHSYIAMPSDQENLLGFCMDEGLEVPAAIFKDNITGLQFHPEKSGEIGLKVLKEFIKL